MSTVAVLQGGRSLERQVSLKSGARVEDALQRLGHTAVAIDVGADLVARLTELAPGRRVRRAARPRRRGRDDPGAAGGARRSPTPARAWRPASAAGTRCWRSTCCAPPGSRRPTSTPSARRPSASWGRRRRCRRSSAQLDFPLVVKPAAQGSALGIKFARTAADVPAALVSAFSYDRKVLLERYVPGRDLAVSIVEEDGEPRALPVVEAVPDGTRLLRLRGALRDRPHALRVPGRAAGRRRGAHAGAGGRGVPRARAAPASRGST